MIQIRGAAAMVRALDQPLDPYLRTLLTLRAAQLGPKGFDDAWIALVEPADGIADVAAEIGYPVTEEGQPTFEWALLHPGGWIEAVWSFGDLTHVVIAQDDDQADAALITLFRDNAVEATAAVAAREVG